LNEVSTRVRDDSIDASKSNRGFGFADCWTSGKSTIEVASGTVETRVGEDLHSDCWPECEVAKSPNACRITSALFLRHTHIVSAVGAYLREN
jgi:hypothetical protein